MNKRKIIIVSTILVLFVLVFVGIFFFKKNNSKVNSEKIIYNQNKNLPTPDFLNEAEKNKLGVSPELKIQALERDNNGNVTVYKVVKTDSDVVSDPSKIEPISPRQLSPKK